MAASFVKKYLFVIFFGLLLHTSAHAASGHSIHWAYSGAGGPENWGHLARNYEICGKGAEQSPIDIRGNDLIGDSEISFHYEPSFLNIINNGHTIQANYNKGSYIKVDGERYDLLQFHFHTPSEHTKDGLHYKMEVHFVHKSNKGKLAVVGAFIAGGKENQALKQLWDNMPAHAKQSKHVAAATINANDILPYNRKHYTYNGSLTTPPCSEGVKWFVLQNYITLSINQIDKFRKVIGRNARPVQARGEHAVMHASSGSQDSHGGGHHAPASHDSHGSTHTSSASHDSHDSSDAAASGHDDHGSKHASASDHDSHSSSHDAISSHDSHGSNQHAAARHDSHDTKRASAGGHDRHGSSEPGAPSHDSHGSKPAKPGDHGSHGGSQHAKPTGPAAHWGYTGHEGPGNWAELSGAYETCGSGLNQSPVDIVRGSPATLDEIEFHYQPAALDVVNNGHTIQVNYAPGSYMIVGGKRYELLQFHFHTPSEHTVEGHSYALEAHFVHENQEGGLAVVGVLMESGGANHVLIPIWEYMPATAKASHQADSLHINAANLLPENKHYYFYNGSLTTPPCSEGVKWFVMEHATSLSQPQLKKFFSVIGANARPVQPHHQRFIREAQFASTGQGGGGHASSSHASGASANGGHASSSHASGGDSHGGH